MYLVFMLPFFLLTSLEAIANDISVTNVSLTGQVIGTNNTNTFTMVEFDLSWKNSWRWSNSSGKITHISVRANGSNYYSAPTVSITGGGGSGATATATVDAGYRLTGITITNPGSGYTSIPTVTLVPTNGGTGATAEAYTTSWWDAAWVFVKYKVRGNYVSAAGATASGSTITVGSTTGLRVGMPVAVTSGNGAFSTGTVVSSIINATSFTVSAAPTTALSNSAIVTGYSFWEHATLNYTGHTAPSGSIIDDAKTYDGAGVFIYRASDGSGNFSISNAQLRWNYRTDGVADNASVDVKVFAIEMIKVHEGAFEVGGSVSGMTNTFSSSTISTSDPTQTTGRPSGVSNTSINSLFPNGFKAFYCMKYEISQLQYVEFLNTLTWHQQSIRTLSTVAPNNFTTNIPVLASGSNGAILNQSGIVLRDRGHPFLTPAVYGCNLNRDANFNDGGDGEALACNFLSWADGCAYLDWAALRPMTELEYEKACRGPIARVNGEFAWGSTSIYSGPSPYSGFSGNISNNITSNFKFNNDIGNAHYSSTYQASWGGPHKVGIFGCCATVSNGVQGRVTSGATYYGIMDMSGNLWEPCVTIENTAGKSFTGKHGNGEINSSGDADVDYWPGINGNESSTTANSWYNSGNGVGVTRAAGSGYRGGGYETSAADQLKVSDRWNAFTPLVNANVPTRNREYGFRGVRSDY